MLTSTQIYENKVKFMTLMTNLQIDMTKLAEYLDKIDYFNKPATTQYYRAYPGGLCQHALLVYNELYQLCNAYFPGRYSDDSIIKVALLKDLYKAVLYEPYNRNVKNEQTGQWEQVVAYRNREERPAYGELGFSSFMLAKQFIPLVDEEIEAICNAAPKETYAPDIHEVFKQFPLSVLTRMAEMVAMYIDA